MKKYRASEIFTPGTYPQYTYCKRENIQHERILQDGLDTDGMLISISGPSKSGKTVLIENIVGKDNLIPITGSGINSIEDLWRKVLIWMGEPDEKSNTSSNTLSTSLSGEVKGGINAIIASGEAKGSLSGGYQHLNSETRVLKKPSLDVIIKEISNSDYVVLIDDFHYIDRDIQQKIAQELKEAIRNNVKIITASIPFHTEDVIRANPDLRGRVYPIDIDYWKSSELINIAKVGTPLLNFNISEDLLYKISADASGSPQLMQQIMICFCHEEKIKETLDNNKYYDLKNFNYNQVMQRAAVSSSYSSLLDKLIDGPKTRGSERKNYILKSGDVGDVYKIIFNAISLDPPSLTFKYQEIVKRIESLCKGESPSGSSIIGSCIQISSIAEELSNEKIFEWDSEYELFNIKDPYILFYLRWSDLLKNVNHKT